MQKTAANKVWPTVLGER